MRAVAWYAVTALAVVAGGSAVAWPFLGAGARDGLLIAGLLALPAQILAFGAMLRGAGSPRGFLPAFAGGTLARLLLVGGAGLAATRFEDTDKATGLILGLVSFLLVLIVLEALFLGRVGKRREESA